MTLLSISTEFKRPNIRDEREYTEAERPIKSLKLTLEQADIVFNKEHKALLAVTSFFGRRIVSIPGGRGLGYLEALDDEIEILKKGGYSLPDWRQVKVVDIRNQYPAWNSE